MNNILTSDSNTSACAHLNVHYVAIQDEKGHTHGHWECSLCKLYFVPLAYYLAKSEIFVAMNASVPKEFTKPGL